MANAAATCVCARDVGAGVRAHACVEFESIINMRGYHKRTTCTPHWTAPGATGPPNTNLLKLSTQGHTNRQLNHTLCY